MDPLTTTAAAGLQAHMDSLDLQANNLANTSTAGYKADREFYSTYIAPELDANADPLTSISPVVEGPWVDFKQGLLQTTGSSTDLAINGQGFFSVNGPNGNTLYTRNGNFQLSPTGVLITSDGYPVRLTNGQTLQVQSTDPLQIDQDGEISQDGSNLGQLELTDFKNPNALTKMGAAYFRPTSAQAAGVGTAENAQVYQGKLESSNAGGAQGSVRIVSLLRQFDMLQKAIKIGSEMNREAIEQVAKVGS
jgi:flagellar basal body rod protein FlgG